MLWHLKMYALASQNVCFGISKCMLWHFKTYALASHIILFNHPDVGWPIVMTAKRRVGVLLVVTFRCQFCNSIMFFLTRTFQYGRVAQCAAVRMQLKA
jgi:hypothetical protein